MAIADLPTTTPPVSATTDHSDEIVARLREAERAIRDCLADYQPSENHLAEAVDAVELSVVMPCLNEADTLATCIEKAQRALAEAGIDGEVIVADNGSTDGSIEIAKRLGARVVNVAEKGATEQR